MKITSIGQQSDEATPYETVKMSIDQSSVDVLMSNLTSLYSNPVEAVMREYSANGVDSHIRAGQSKPVLISIPTDSLPFFVVEDFGVGMSKDEIANVYSRYGLSTKSGNNDEIGGFGLGCKSALAIADRFDIVSVKDGVRVEAFIQKNTKGVGVVHFVSETDTTAPTGVKITIPVSANKVSSFQQTVGMFDTWAVGSVLVDGEPNKAVQYGDNWLEIAPAGEPVAWIEMNNRVVYSPTRYISGNSIISNVTYTVGGIHYNFERANSFSISEKFGKSETVTKMSVLAADNKVIINLPIGSADLTPSREALMLTDKTINAIKASFADVVENFRITANDFLEGLELAEAVKVYANNHVLFADEIDFSSHGYRANLVAQRPEFYGVKHHGEEIPTWVSVKPESYFGLDSVEGQALGQGSPVNVVYTLNAHNATVSNYGRNQPAPNNVIVKVSGVLEDSVKESFRKNLRDYAKSVFDSTNINALLTNDSKVSEWVTLGYAPVTFEVFMETARKYRSMKKSMAQVGVKRSSTSYPVLDLSNIEGTIHKVSIDDMTGDGSEYVYLSFDNDNLNALDGRNVWATVNDVARGARGRVTTGIGFHKAFYNVFPGKKLVFIGKGKKSETFVKKFPKAVSYNEGVANSLKKVIKAGKSDVFAGIVSVSGRSGRSVSAFEAISASLLEKGMIGSVADVYTRDVLTAIGASDEMFQLAQMFESNQSVMSMFGEVTEKAKELDFTGRFSLLRRMSFYSRHETLDENDLKQIVMLFNAITA